MIDPSKTTLAPSEIEQAQRIFDAVWPELASEKGEGNIHFPKKLYWLNGAPGAGKGTQTRFIMNLKSIEAAPVVVSDLLTTPEMQQLKDAGIMVGDKEVVALLLRKILEFSGKEGLIIDGFPAPVCRWHSLKCSMLNSLKSMLLHPNFISSCSTLMKKSV